MVGGLREELAWHKGMNVMQHELPFPLDGAIQCRRAAHVAQEGPMQHSMWLRGHVAHVV